MYIYTHFFIRFFFKAAWNQQSLKPLIYKLVVHCDGEFSCTRSHLYLVLLTCERITTQGANEVTHTHTHTHTESRQTDVYESAQSIWQLYFPLPSHGPREKFLCRITMRALALICFRDAVIWWCLTQQVSCRAMWKCSPAAWGPCCSERWWPEGPVCDCSPSECWVEGEI